MLSRFDTDTQLQAVDEGLFTGHISPAWNIGANPNGGYLLAVVLSALRGLNPEHPDPLSVTSHFLRPGIADTACEVRVNLLRRGRTLTTARATLAQAGKARLEVLAAFGDLGAVGTTAGSTADVSLLAPQLPAPELCPLRSAKAQGVDLPILDSLEIRVNPADLPEANSGRAQVSGWIRLADQTQPSSLAAVTFCDAFPPALFGLLGVIGWVPTIELTVHVRRRPTTAWLRGQFVTDDLHGGRMIESGALWDEGGALIAQARQLGLLLGNAES